MVRLAAFGVAVFIVFALAWMASGLLRRLPARRAPRSSSLSGPYEWERRRDQLYRRVKAVPAPEEDREAILRFVESKNGVEAFVEPRTVIHPLSVVLVAEDGEWARFQLKDDSFLRELARARGLRVNDASKVGYPERMRRYRRGEPREPGAGTDGKA